MDQPLRKHHTRLSSEQIQRRLIYELVNRVNITLKYKKTSEEKERIKVIVGEYKQAMREQYGDKYNRNKILNLPGYTYQITENT